jgi:hypothetical protein
MTLRIKLSYRLPYIRQRVGPLVVCPHKCGNVYKHTP